MLGVTAGVALVFGVTYYKLNPQAKLNRFLKASLFPLQAREILDIVLDKTSICNAVLFSVHNNGGEILAGTKLYSSVIVEKPINESVSFESDWQNMLIDHELMQVLRHTDSSKGKLLITDTMNEGILKRTHISKSITGAVYFKVYNKTSSSYYHAAFMSDGETSTLTGDDFIHFEYAINKLSNLCKDFDKQGVLK